MFASIPSYTQAILVDITSIYEGFP